MIEPTVGHTVWYHPGPEEAYGGQTLAAIVAFVWGPELVNLCVIDPNGQTFPKTSVPFIQDGAKAPAGLYAEFHQEAKPKAEQAKAETKKGAK
jgi:hypothetical protein